MAAKLMSRSCVCRLAAAGFLLLTFCSRAPHAPVRGAVTGAVEAAEARDADAVVAYLSPSFRDADEGGKAEAAETVRRYLAGYESLSLTVSNLTLERNGPVAQAAFTLKMSGKPRAASGLEGFLPRRSRWRFELRLEDEKGAWKITHATWRQLDEGG